MSRVATSATAGQLTVKQTELVMILIVIVLTTEQIEHGQLPDSKGISVARCALADSTMQALVPGHSFVTVPRLSVTQGERRGDHSSASNPGLPRPDNISQPWRKNPIFLQGCKIKSGRGRPGFEANHSSLYLTSKPTPLLCLIARCCLQLREHLTLSLKSQEIL